MWSRTGHGDWSYGARDILQLTIELGSVSKSLCYQNRYRTWHRWMIRVISLKRSQLHLAQVVQVVERAQFRQLKQQPLHQSSTIMDQNRDQNIHQSSSTSPIITDQQDTDENGAKITTARSTCFSDGGSRWTGQGPPGSCSLNEMRNPWGWWFIVVYCGLGDDHPPI